MLPIILSVIPGTSMASANCDPNRATVIQFATGVPLGVPPGKVFPSPNYEYSKFIDCLGGE